MATDRRLSATPRRFQNSCVRRVALALMLAAACGGAPEAIEGDRAIVDFDADGFYASPFPSDHRYKDGRLDLDDFPNPRRLELVRSIRQAAAKETNGFGVTSAVYFSTTAPVDTAALPDVLASVEPGSPVFLTSLDEPRRVPIVVAFREDGGPHGAPNLLSLLPLQGTPLAPNQRYAAVVTRALLPGVAADTVAILDGKRPEGMSEDAFERYDAAVEVLESRGVARDEIAALAVFTTGDPTIDLIRAYEAATAPVLDAPFEHVETFDDYCVFRATTMMPVYQSGEPPYRPEGGGWIMDADGRPELQRMVESRVFVTVPRVEATDGYPGVLFVRTGGGGDRPLIERGVRAEEGGAAIEPGSGPARNFARAGIAGVMVDGPHGGLRNPKNQDEQFLIFNFENPPAMRDNIRQSALELALARDLIGDITITSTACPGASGTVRFDDDRIALFGHSMGATIGPLTLAIEPRFGAAILSGAGGSWIENVVHKQRPLPVKPIAELLLEYAESGAEIHEHDPALNLLQWAGESADPPVYASSIGAHVLMFQGIVDTYILPPIANALSLSLGADLAGEAKDDSLVPLLGLVERTRIELPASGNRDGRTVVVVQHDEDPIEDGHEVVFQTEGPKHQYRCFLERFAAGETPAVPVAGTEWADCD